MLNLNRLFLANVSLAELKANLGREDLPDNLRKSFLAIQERYKDKIPRLDIDDESLAIVAKTIRTHHRSTKLRHDAYTFAYVLNHHVIVR